MSDLDQAEISMDEISEDVVLQVIEDSFLDPVFGTRSKLERNEFIERVQQKASWILSAEEVRQRVKQKLEMNKRQGIFGKFVLGQNLTRNAVREIGTKK